MSRPRRRLVPLLLLAAGCSRGAVAPPPGPLVWSVARGDAWEAILGRSAARTAWQVGRWFGRQPAPDATPPAVLDAGRAALAMATPGRVRIPLRGSGPWRFRARPALPPEAGAVQLRILAETPDPVLLADLALAPGPSPPLDVQLPAGSLALDLVTRHPGTGQEARPGPEVLLGEARVVEATASPPPAVLLVSIDTLRGDALVHAPRLRALFARGWLWTDAVSPANWTLPSYASLFTARPVPDHGAGRADLDHVVSGGPLDLRGVRPELPLLAEELRRAGWATAMVHQNPFLEPWTGLQRGFDLWMRTRDDPATGLAEGRRWWEEHSGEPRLLVLQILGPHLPYDPPGAGDDLPADPLDRLPWREFLARDHDAEARRRFFDLPAKDREAIRRRYAAEVAAADAILAPWLEELAATPSPPLMVLHSDHGEEHWEEGSFEHGHAFPEVVVRVPLGILAPPWTDAPRPPWPARVRDTAPTLLAWLDLPRPPGWEGDLRRRPASWLCAGPLHPGPLAGVRLRFGPGGPVREPIPAGPGSGADGPPARLDPDLAAALAELGYGGG